MAMSPRVRGVLRYVGYVVLALVTFVFALHLTFPYERVRDRALEALQSKYDVTIDGVERSLVPGRFALTGVTLRSRPSVAGQPTTTMYFKRIEIDLAFAPLVSGKVKIGLAITTNKGRITGSIVQAKHETAYAFDLAKVPLTMIPGVSDAVGLPMYGNADGKVRLKLVRNDWSKANGVFELACTVGCTIGNGEAKIYPKSKRPGDEAWTKDGVAVPALQITRFKLAIDIVKGNAKKRTFELVSKDGEADVDVDIKLAKVITESTITGCIRYKCSKELYAREPKFSSQCDFGSPVIDGKGMHHIKLMGKLSNVRRIGALCDGQQTDAGGGGAASGGNDRPRFDPGPVEVVQPIVDAGVAPVEPPPPPPPPPAIDPAMLQPRDDVPRPEGAAVNGVGSGANPAGIPQPPPPPIVQPAPPPPPGSAYPGDSARPGGNVVNGDTATPPQPQPN
jgi:type II secretion system protein N